MKAPVFYDPSGRRKRWSLRALFALIIALAIIIIVLIQPAESGGFIGNAGGMSNMMAPRRRADVMTRATTILAGCFFATSLLLAIIAGNRPRETSILDAAPAAAEQQKQQTAPELPPMPEQPPKQPEAPKAPLAK